MKLLSAPTLTLLAAAALLPSSVLAAESTVFEALDSVGVEYYNGPQLKLRGVVQGESAAREISLDEGRSYDGPGVDGLANLCERQALMVISKPGQFLFTVRSDQGSLSGCSLKRR